MTYSLFPPFPRGLSMDILVYSVPWIMPKSKWVVDQMGPWQEFLAKRPNLKDSTAIWLSRASFGTGGRSLSTTGLDITVESSGQSPSSLHFDGEHLHDSAVPRSPSATVIRKGRSFESISKGVRDKYPIRSTRHPTWPCWGIWRCFVLQFYLLGYQRLICGLLNMSVFETGQTGGIKYAMGEFRIADSIKIDSV